MKSINYIIALIIIAGSSLSSSAQTIYSYTIQLPNTVLSEGGSIFIEPFTNTGEEQDATSKAINEHIALYINSNGLGSKKTAKVYSPWLSTKIYNVASSAEEANYIISGSYSLESKKSKSYDKKMINEKRDEKTALQIYYFNYTAEGSADIRGEAKIKAKDGTEVRTYPLNFNKKDSKSKSLEIPSIEDPTAYYKTLKNSAVRTVALDIAPVLIECKYRFKNVRTKNKDIKKAYKAKFKQAEDLGKKGKVREMGRLLLELEAMDGNADLFENLGMSYELIGNLTKAQEYYQRSGDRACNERINKMIEVKEVYQKLGIEIIEGEF